MQNSVCYSKFLIVPQEPFSQCGALPSWERKYHVPSTRSSAPARRIYLSLYVAIAAAVIALAMLSALLLSGPRQMDRFARGAYYCQPFVGKMPYC